MSYKFTDEERLEFLNSLRRDDGLTEYLEYLDGLRESGVTNMYGAVPYLMEEFELDRREAGAVLVEWMQTFSERKNRGEVTA